MYLVDQSTVVDSSPMFYSNFHLGRSASVKQPWHEQEKAVVLKSLKISIDRMLVPGKQQCQACIDSAPDILKRRDWRAVKYFVNNHIEAIKRKTCKSK